jgi:hypothetical protein
VAFGRVTRGDINRVRDSGRDSLGSGIGITDSAVGDLRSISGDFRDLIRRGGLTDAVSREYDVQQGRISDDVVRAGKGFRAMLTQQAQANGGYLSPAAQAALAKENEVELNSSAFDARNKLSFEKARVSQESTARLQTQLLEIADMIRTTGLTREQQGFMAQIQALAARTQKNQQWGQAATAAFGGMF